MHFLSSKTAWSASRCNCRASKVFMMTSYSQVLPDTIFLFANMNCSLNMISPIWFPYLDCSYFSFWDEMNEIKIVSYSFSSSVIEYNSNEKLLKQGSLLQKSSLCLIMMWWKLDTVETNCIIFILYTKIKSTQKA